MSAHPAPLPGPALRLLGAAPHRLLFFAGATNVLLAMTWWALWLADARWRWFEWPQPAVPAGWLHAVVMQYHVLPTFMFGFLLTVFPRWMNQLELPRRHYLAVGLGLFGGQVLTLAGALGPASMLHAGAVATLIGWGVGLLFLGRVVWRDRARTWHAVSCTIALGLGWLGLLLYAAVLHGADGRVMAASIKLGGWGFLLPIFFTVCHRMIPFFTGRLYPGYRVVQPLWTLALFWVLALAHAGMEVSHGRAWLWLVDLPLALLAGSLLWAWRPRAERMPALLRVLFFGFAWLPIAFALYAVQSLWHAATGELVLGRAPAHALFIGGFGSLLVAMVTRVTQGHSGRPLVLGHVAAFAFVLLQVVAVTRIAAEVAPDPVAWHVIAAIGWIVAFLPWAARSMWIYLTPRRDGLPG